MIVLACIAPSHEGLRWRRCVGPRWRHGSGSSTQDTRAGCERACEQAMFTVSRSQEAEQRSGSRAARLRRAEAGPAARRADFTHALMNSTLARTRPRRPKATLFGLAARTPPRPCRARAGLATCGERRCSAGAERQQLLPRSSSTSHGRLTQVCRRRGCAGRGRCRPGGWHGCSGRRATDTWCTSTVCGFSSFRPLACHARLLPRLERVAP